MEVRGQFLPTLADGGSSCLIKMNWIDFTYNILVHPCDAMWEVCRRRHWVVVIAIVVCSGVSAAIAILLPVKFGFPGAGNTLGVLITMVILGIVISWFINAGILHFFAGLWGGDGKPCTFLAASGVSMFPLLFLVPLAIISQVAPAGVLWFLLGLLVVTVWSVYLLIDAISTTYHMLPGRAVAVILTPTLIILVIMLITAGVLGSML